MNRQSFAILLNKYLNGNCTSEEQKIVEQWYDLLEEVPDNEWNIKDLEEKLWQKIKGQTIGNNELLLDEKPTLTFWKKNNFKMGIAASILLLLGIFTWNYLQKGILKTSISMEQNTPKGMLETQNLSNQAKKIILEDGSQITLQPQSKLSYPKHFNSDKREVYLTGEGFFEVQKNPQKPFFVYTGNITTKVLGTSFHVKSFDGIKKVEVEVVSGRVSVYEKENDETKTNKQTNGVILLPNHKVTFFAESNLFVTNIVANPIIQTSKIQDTKVFFEFDDTPMSEVLKKLREAYGLEIIVENEIMNDCILTADITKQSLYTKLDIICAAVGATYEVKGTTILINGKGCE